MLFTNSILIFFLKYNKVHGVTSTNSHRDSVTSIKSINSDTEEYNKQKIILDETVNPKRPLRPNRLTTQNSVSSPSNSNQSSRPGSHISGEELNSISMLQFNSSSTNTTTDGLMMQEEIDFEVDTQKNSSMKPPPKPPKPNKMKKTSNTSLILQENDSSLNDQHVDSKSNFQSNQHLNNTNNANTNGNNNGSHQQKELHQTKSNTSLNKNIQFKNLGTKTSSDSILNRVIKNCFLSLVV